MDTAQANRREREQEWWLSPSAIFARPRRWVADLVSHPERLLSVVAGLAFAAMILLCTMEDHSRVGRVIATAVALLATGFGASRGWFSVRHLRPVLAPLAAVYTALILSCLFSISPAFSFDNFLEQHLWYGLIFLGVAAWASTPERQQFFLRGILAATLYSAATGIFFYYMAPRLAEAGLVDKVSDFYYTATNEQGEVYYRARGLFQSYTDSAIFMALALPAAVALVFQAARENRRAEMVVALSTAVLAAYYLLLTKSRGAWLGAFAGLLLICLLMRVTWWVYAAGAMVIALILACSPAERSRALTLIQDLTDPDLFLSGRLVLWEQAREPIEEHLWTGLGYGGNIFLTDEAAEKGYALASRDTVQPDLHHLYLQTLAEVGIIGLLAYLWFVGTLVFFGWRRIRAERGQPSFLGVYTTASALSALLVMGFVYFMNEDLVAHAMWAMAGLMAGGAAADSEPPQS